jgi:hypothetical protein
MTSRDICKLLKATLQSECRQTDPNLVPGWDYKRLSVTIGYCADRDYIDVEDVTSMESPHKEYIVLGVTADGYDYLRDHTLRASLPQLVKGAAIALIAIGTLIAGLLPDAGKVWVWHKVSDIVHLSR